MSNYLAIATVTAALQRILQEGIREDVPGATVTIARPDNPTTMSQTIGINLYLYQATPNPAWRNVDLRTRRPKGDLIKHGQAGLDLHYLLTFYGNEQDLEPQRLLGSAIRTLVDQPILTQAMIQETIENSSLPFLTDSTLADQIELVKFIPGMMNTEELSRIWSIFFQIPYTLSFAYQGTAVLIQGEKPGKLALPVRRRQFYVASTRPIIDKVVPDQTIEQAITCNSSLIIHGRQLQATRTLVQIGETRITPQSVLSHQVKVQLALLDPSEAVRLRAGVQGIQVIHLPQVQPLTTADYAIESNVAPLILCPTILPQRDSITLSNLEERDEDAYWGDVTVQVDVIVAPEQRVFLLLNGLSEIDPQTYIFRAEQRTRDSRVIVFSLQNVMAGDYFVRVQIDGAESPLDWDEEAQLYTGPSITVP